jgi:4-hydroxybutyryl-CoA dehydratase/vinylacetyl-CoA-Delta-isomerase
VQDTAGGLLVRGPSEADLDSPDVGKYVRISRRSARKRAGGKPPQGHKSCEGAHRDRLLRYQAVLAIHAEGSIEAEKLAMVREHDSLRCTQLAKRLAGIVDGNLERQN